MSGRLIGPIQFDAKVHLVNPDTGDTAVVTFGFAPGRVPDMDAIDEGLVKVLEHVKGHGLKLMGASTFFNYVLVKEQTGRVGNFALPSEFDYDTFGLETAEAPGRYLEEDFEDE